MQNYVTTKLYRNYYKNSLVFFIVHSVHVWCEWSSSGQLLPVVGELCRSAMNNEVVTR